MIFFNEYKYDFFLYINIVEKGLMTIFKLLNK
jgi:hypothetical protein